MYAAHASRAVLTTEVSQICLSRSPEPVRPPVPPHDLRQHHRSRRGERHHTLVLDHLCGHLLLHARVRTHEQWRA